MGIEIRDRFSMDDWEAARAFLSENYRPDLALRSRRFFEWQFQADPSSGEAALVSAWDGGRLVAILGHVPRPTFWGDTGGPVPGAAIINWMVAPGHRGHGLGGSMLRRLWEIYPVLTAVGVTAANVRVVTRLGWSVFERIPRLLRVPDAGRAVPLLMPGASPDDLRPFARPGRAPGGVAARRLGPEVDYRPDWRLYPALSYGVVRSRPHLQWRYLDHPAFDYAVELTGDPGRPAVCACRVETARGLPGGVKALRVVEFFHPNDPQGEADGAALIESVLRRAADEGCVYADFIGTNSGFNETLRGAGWEAEPGDRMVLPVRLSPVEFKPFRYEFEYGASGGRAGPPLDALYVTKADGDADRPASISEVRDHPR